MIADKNGVLDFAGKEQILAAGAPSIQSLCGYMPEQKQQMNEQR